VNAVADEDCVGRAANGGSTMLLDGKNAIIYGGGGDIGGAVARAFTR
jgi:hypothetical protein